VSDLQISPEEMQSALFAQLIMQQANMAFMLMGKVPHPDTGKSVRDLDAAKLFVDLIEMIEAKTKGNLNAQESALLKQTLMSLRLGFVEAVNEPPPAEEKQVAESQPPVEEKEKSPAAEPATGKNLLNASRKSIPESDAYFFSSVFLAAGFSAAAGGCALLNSFIISPTCFNFSSMISTFASLVSFST
jgi:hypothetical protein